MGLGTQENQLAVHEIDKSGAIPTCGSDALRFSLSLYKTEVRILFVYVVWITYSCLLGLLSLFSLFIPMLSAH